MDKRLTRFRTCDSEFYPYLDKVLARLPEIVKEDVLNNRAFEILADGDVLEAGVVRYEFDSPIRNLLYLNPKLLKEPEHQIVYTIAREISYYVLGKRETSISEKEAEDLIKTWGFKEEFDAVRYDQAVSESEGYRSGYEWAINQDKEYLLQHFGLYFDEWNEKGLGRLSSEEFEMLHDHTDTPSILEDLTRSKQQDSVDSINDKIEAPFSLKEEIIAGVMAAVKEMKSNETVESIIKRE